MRGQLGSERCGTLGCDSGATSGTWGYALKRVALVCAFLLVPLSGYAQEPMSQAAVASIATETTAPVADADGREAVLFIAMQLHAMPDLFAPGVREEMTN